MKVQGQGMKNMMGGLALEYKRSFPLLEGLILKTEERQHCLSSVQP